MFDALLIANRGEIAVRIARTARRLGIRTVAVYSDADRDALHVAVADEAIRIGPAPALESYLRGEAVIAAALRTGTQAIHPGYGFLSENPDFVEAVAAAGLTFVGPPANAIRAMGLKDAAKALMDRAGVPTVPGYHGQDQDGALLAREAARVGYPVLIKAAAGGGGKGMRRVDVPDAFAGALASARREAKSAFGDDRVLIERCLLVPRHIEIQVFADRHGGAVHLFERDCSLQRRHQKVIEEAPAPGMPPAMRAAMGAAAVKAARAVGYEGAGTVEFIADVTDGLQADRFYFMEMNTRLQVEHPVTELITGLDLVEWQLRVAAGEPLPLRQEQLAIHGHAVEARLYAEDPAQNFLPQTGQLAALALAGGDGIRVDAGVRQGDVITPYYDPMIAKIVAHAPSREAALRRLRTALDESRVSGTLSNLRFLARLVAVPQFVAGNFDTGFIGRHLEMLLGAGDAPPEATALVALEVAGVLSVPSGSDPFARLANLRIWGDARRNLKLLRDGTSYDVTVTAARDGVFRVAERDGPVLALRVVEQDDDRIRIDIDGHLRAVRLGRENDDIVVAVAGKAFRYQDVTGRRDGGATVGAAAGSGTVRAAGPGLVQVVHVTAGQHVAKGDPLVVTEAMKMEMTLTAPISGHVAAVEVTAGDQVQTGTVLVVVAPADG